LLKSIYRFSRQRDQKLGFSPRAKPQRAWKSPLGTVHPAVVQVVVLLLLGAVVGFAWIGIAVARESEAYQAFIWVPRLLAVLSGFLIATTLWRMVRRWIL
jgi:hypothetical protein